METKHPHRLHHMAVIEAWEPLQQEYIALFVLITVAQILIEKMTINQGSTSARSTNMLPPVNEFYAIDKILETVSSHMEGLTSAMKNQLRFNKMHPWGG
ncbi:hypothetical protein ACJX0J_021365, partial [Zea mays]